jgi:CheY-like chemotaxis protein
MHAGPADAVSAFSSDARRAADPRRPSVLLIEDNATLRYALGVVLKSAEYDLTAVSSARSAHLAANARAKNGDGAVDLIMCDLHLPDARGDQLVSELIPLLTPRGVLLLSGAGIPDGVIARLATYSPHVGFLQKPVDAEELLEVARSMLA